MVLPPHVPRRLRWAHVGPLTGMGREQTCRLNVTTSQIFNMSRHAGSQTHFVTHVAQRHEWKTFMLNSISIVEKLKSVFLPVCMPEGSWRLSSGCLARGVGLVGFQLSFSKRRAGCFQDCRLPLAAVNLLCQVLSDFNSGRTFR